MEEEREVDNPLNKYKMKNKNNSTTDTESSNGKEAGNQFAKNIKKTKKEENSEEENNYDKIDPMGTEVMQEDDYQADKHGELPEDDQNGKTEKTEK